jgi:L-serine dehydratase
VIVSVQRSQANVGLVGEIAKNLPTGGALAWRLSDREDHNRRTLRTSLFEIFKIGIGPSSSHTVGPMRAAGEFVSELGGKALLMTVRRVQVDLYGSLALSGRGHATDRGVIFGLCGELPDRIDPSTMESRLQAFRETKRLPLRGMQPVPFDEAKDLVFHTDQELAKHPNGMRFTAFDASESILLETVYYSIGGGFILREGAEDKTAEPRAVPYPFASATELLDVTQGHRLPIWKIVLENEKVSHSETEIRNYLERIWKTMQECTARGMSAEGILPGGLRVHRRAPALARRLEKERPGDLLHAMDWLNVFAIAVNEENAAGGRMVSAPTNGAAGVIPAVAHFYVRFLRGSPGGIVRYLLAATAIGMLYKENASISGAEVGCQGEVGVACSMAAGGLVSALEGTNERVEHAAEIAMEHNLGLTCDPVGGLVQIPCIERNAFGAVKAVNAARLAMQETGGHKVSLDQVIKTMHETGKDMQVRYKQTSLGGLALSVIEC